MEEFEFEVTLTVRVNAFSESDAWDALTEAYAVGENCGTTVVDCEYADKGPAAVKKKKK